MKKIIFFSFLMFASILHAQQKTIHKPAPIPVQPKPQPPDKWFGIVAGPNLNYLNYSDKSTTIGGNNTGFHAGIFFQKNINKYKIKIKKILSNQWKENIHVMYYLKEIYNLKFIYWSNMILSKTFFLN